MVLFSWSIASWGWVLDVDMLRRRRVVFNRRVKGESIHHTRSTLPGVYWFRLKMILSALCYTARATYIYWSSVSVQREVLEGAGKT